MRTVDRLVFERRFGAALAAADLSDDALRNVNKAAEKFEKLDARLRAQQEGAQRALRMAVLGEAADGKLFDQMAVEPDEGEAAPAEEEPGEEAKPVAAKAEGKGGTESNGMMGALQQAFKTKKLRSDIAKLQAQRLELETAFLAKLSSTVPPEHASALAAALKPTPADAEGAGGNGGGASALSGMQSAAASARLGSKSVYVLKFNGDVTASQVLQGGWGREAGARS